ncbi:MAG: DUF4041 domain-containing protein [Bacteroidetes bacterium]|nr:DUF4041 domain-containing protein [Bacteroidota bacterium]
MILTSLLSISVVIIAILYFQDRKKMQQALSDHQEISEQLSQLKNKYKDIISVDEVLSIKHKELGEVELKIVEKQIYFDAQKSELSKNYQEKRDIYQKMLEEMSVLEERLDIISYGFYKPSFSFDSSEKYKQELEKIWQRQKDLIKNDTATYYPKDWTVNGSKAEGLKMVKQQSKLMLRAFNGECDSAIAKVKWNNIGTIEARIDKAFETINSLGSVQRISISQDFASLKRKELRLEFELQEKLHEEKEEQKRIREQMREEQKVLQEIERAKQNAEDEEAKSQKALAKARNEMAKVSGAELDALNERIAQLEQNLQAAQEQKARAISQAQQTKRGHVYIISNVGSFGENVFKIGMTRRLEPLDRVYELGDASVPFEFDVHAMIFSENAPELERTLHKKLDHHRLNLVDTRAEFFSTDLEEIEKIIVELHGEIKLTRLAEAKEYRTTLTMREARKIQTLKSETPSVQKELQAFPSSLD